MSSNRQRITVAGLIVIVMILVVAMYVGYVDLTMREEEIQEISEVLGISWFSGSERVADLVEIELKKLAPGHILFNPSKEMTLGITEKVEIRIAKNLTENLRKGLEGRGEPQIVNVSIVNTIMEVSLIGESFHIELIGSSLFCMGNSISLISAEADYMRGMLNVERP